MAILFAYNIYYSLYSESLGILGTLRGLHRLDQPFMEIGVKHAEVQTTLFFIYDWSGFSHCISAFALHSWEVFGYWALFLCKTFKKSKSVVNFDS